MADWFSTADSPDSDTFPAESSNVGRSSNTTCSPWPPGSTYPSPASRSSTEAATVGSQRTPTNMQYYNNREFSPFAIAPSRRGMRNNIDERLTVDSAPSSGSTPRMGTPVDGSDDTWTEASSETYTEIGRWNSHDERSPLIPRNSGHAMIHAMDVGANPEVEARIQKVAEATLKREKAMAEEREKKQREEERADLNTKDGKTGEVGNISGIWNKNKTAPLPKKKPDHMRQSRDSFKRTSTSKNRTDRNGRSQSIIKKSDCESEKSDDGRPRKKGQDNIRRNVPGKSGLHQGTAALQDQIDEDEDLARMLAKKEGKRLSQRSATRWGQIKQDEEMARRLAEEEGDDSQYYDPLTKLKKPKKNRPECPRCASGPHHPDCEYRGSGSDHAASDNASEKTAKSKFSMKGLKREFSTLLRRHSIRLGRKKSVQFFGVDGAGRTDGEESYDSDGEPRRGRKRNKSIEEPMMSGGLGPGDVPEYMQISRSRGVMSKSKNAKLARVNSVLQKLSMAPKDAAVEDKQNKQDETPSDHVHGEDSETAKKIRAEKREEKEDWQRWRKEKEDCRRRLKEWREKGGEEEAEVRHERGPDRHKKSGMENGGEHQIRQKRDERKIKRRGRRERRHEGAVSHSESEEDTRYYTSVKYRRDSSAAMRSGQCAVM